MKIERIYFKRPLIYIFAAELIYLFVDMFFTGTQTTTLFFLLSFSSLNLSIRTVYYHDIFNDLNKPKHFVSEREKRIAKIILSLAAISAFILFFSWGMSFHTSFSVMQLASLSTGILACIFTIYTIWYKWNLHLINRQVEYDIIFIFQWFLAFVTIIFAFFTTH